MAQRKKKPTVKISNYSYHWRPMTIIEFGEWYKVGTMTSADTSIDSPQDALTRDEFIAALKKVTRVSED